MDSCIWLQILTLKSQLTKIRLKLLNLQVLVAEKSVRYNLALAFWCKLLQNAS